MEFTYMTEGGLKTLCMNKNYFIIRDEPSFIFQLCLVSSGNPTSINFATTIAEERIGALCRDEKTPFFYISYCPLKLTIVHL